MWRAAVTHSEAAEAHLHQRSQQPAALPCTSVLRRGAGGLPTCRHKASHAGRPHARRSLLAGRQELLLRRHAGRGPHGAAGWAGGTTHHRRLLLHWLHWLPLQGGRLAGDHSCQSPSSNQSVPQSCLALSDAWQLPRQQQCRRRHATQNNTDSNCRNMLGCQTPPTSPAWGRAACPAVAASLAAAACQGEGPSARRACQGAAAAAGACPEACPCRGAAAGAAACHPREGRAAGPAMQRDAARGESGSAATSMQCDKQHGMLNAQAQVMQHADQQRGRAAPALTMGCTKPCGPPMPGGACCACCCGGMPGGGPSPAGGTGPPGMPVGGPPGGPPGKCCCAGAWPGCGAPAGGPLGAPAGAASPAGLPAYLGSCARRSSWLHSSSVQIKPSTVGPAGFAAAAAFAAAGKSAPPAGGGAPPAAAGNSGPPPGAGPGAAPGGGMPGLRARQNEQGCNASVAWSNNAAITAPGQQQRCTTAPPHTSCTWQMHGGSNLTCDPTLTCSQAAACLAAACQGAACQGACHREVACPEGRSQEGAYRMAQGASCLAGACRRACCGEAVARCKARVRAIHARQARHQAASVHPTAELHDNRQKNSQQQCTHGSKAQKLAKAGPTNTHG